MDFSWLIVIILVGSYQQRIKTEAFSPSNTRNRIISAPVLHNVLRTNNNHYQSRKQYSILYAQLWERLQIDEDEEPMWYLLNCVATNEIALLSHCRETCKDMADVVKFVVPSERLTRSHGPNRMLTEKKVKYPGYVFAKLRLFQETYEAIQNLDLCRSWMGTVNHKGYKKLPPAPIALNELEVENFGLDDIDADESFDEQTNNNQGTKSSINGIIMDDDSDDNISESDPMYKNVDKKALKQFVGLKVEDYIKVIAKGKYFNEDGFIRRLKDGKIFVRFYTYGTMFEDWLEPKDVRKLSNEEVLKGLVGPGEPITQRDIDGPQDRGSNNYQKKNDRRIGLNNNVQRNRRQDRVVDKYASNRGNQQTNEYDRRKEDDNWNWYKQQQNDNKDKESGSVVSDEQWTMRSGSGNQMERDNNNGNDNRNRQFDRKPPPRNQQQRNWNDNRQNEAAIEGKDDWSSFVTNISPADRRRSDSQNNLSSSSRPAPDFFSSLITDLSKDLDSTSSSGGGYAQGRSTSINNNNRPPQTNNNRPPTKTTESASMSRSNNNNNNEDDNFFTSLMSDLAQNPPPSDKNRMDNNAPREQQQQQQHRSSSSTLNENVGGEDDFFASLLSELDGPDTQGDTKKSSRMQGVDGQQPPQNKKDNSDDFYATVINDNKEIPSTKLISNEAKDVPSRSDVSIESSRRKPAVVNTNELSGRTIPDLKDMLRDKGLKVSGKKAELIERLLTSS